jgi:hypothetical protein
MALRALAASSTWRNKKEVRKAGEFLTNRFFKPDKYEDRRHASYWKEITYPFWATDILSSLDALSQIGFTLEDSGVRKAVEWLLRQQNSQGYWEAASKKSSLENHLWITLVVLRVLKRFGLLEL